MNINGDPVDILVVEDNYGERESIVEAIEAAKLEVRIAAVGDGTQALDFLFARGQWSHRAGLDPPRLILLDLEMPGSDGFSVLGKIRSIEPQDALTVAPIVVFSNSQAAGDIAKSYRCGANSYVIKPLSFLDFQAVVESIAQYWMKNNKTSV